MGAEVYNHSFALLEALTVRAGLQYHSGTAIAEMPRIGRIGIQSETVQIGPFFKLSRSVPALIAVYSVRTNT